MNRNWIIGVDTGGTFTDGLAIAPDGVQTRWKVLSTGCLRGKIIEKLTNRQYRVQQNWGIDADIFSGYSLTVVIERSTLRISGCNPVENVLTFETSQDITCPQDFELSADEEAPILICRLATKTPLQQSFPAMTLRLGTTRGTNALLEGKGAKTTLLVTAGFGDLLAIGHQQRPNIFELNIPSRKKLAAQIIEVKERINRDGTIQTALELDCLSKLKTAHLEAVAISLMHSHKNSSHENLLQREIHNKGVTYVSCASGIAPFTGYLAKTETTLINAYLTPVIEKYLSEIRTHLRGNEFLMMNSAGNLEHEQLFQPKNSFVSGPAGGCAASAQWAISNRRKQIITFDMGGTSTDTARYANQFTVKNNFQIDGMEVITPSLDIHTVAAGGGSIISYSFGQIQIGPESAGAYPGPACYGLSGPLTLTDVNVLLGKVYAHSFKIPIHPEAAQTAFEAFRTSMDNSETTMTPEHDLLLGIEQIANEKMADAIKKISIGRGFDPAEHSLLVYGGAGGLHACKIAGLLGLTEIAIPYDGGIWSAKGMALAGKSLWVMHEVLELWQNCKDELEYLFSNLLAEAKIKIGGGTEILPFQTRVLARLKGQDTSLDIMWPGKTNFMDAFTDTYKSTYGYKPTDPQIEIERVQILAGQVIEELSIKHAEPIPYIPVPAAEVVPYYYSGIKYPVYKWEELRPGALLNGPAVVANNYGTTFIEEGWQFILDPDQTLMGKNYQKAFNPLTSQQTIIGTSLFMNRFTSIAEEMGAQLERSATSVNIKERKDFSCAILDREGYLLVNAPHIPVHLGSLGICCRLSVHELKLGKDDVLITNHPAFGGSHLPDLTLIAPVYAEDTLVGFVANRAHHAEVGGKTPGSMPVDATTLVEEGVILRPMYLVKNGEVQWSSVEQLFTQAPYPTRNWPENKADLIAALAALQRGKQELIHLVQKHCLETVIQRMHNIRQLASAALKPLFISLAGKIFEATEYLDDGHKIQVVMSIDHTGMTIDFSHSSPVHPHNLNANVAIVYSALLYFLRIWVNKDIPLNEGLLENVQLILPHGMLNPEFGPEDTLNPAVVGGNTEVSQRLVDTLFKAIGLAACSQGTMNNFLFGNDTFGYYETIGGGVGATSQGPGRSGCHQHMTNTKITDPEIIEIKYPVQLERFALRSNSGGQGKWRGGDGLIRRIRFLKPLKVTFLSQHRLQRPYGLAGGLNGAPGDQWLETKAGIKHPLPGITQLNIQPGEVIHIETPGGGGFGILPQGNKYHKSEGAQ